MEQIVVIIFFVNQHTFAKAPKRSLNTRKEKKKNNEYPSRSFVQSVGCSSIKELRCIT